MPKTSLWHGRPLDKGLGCLDTDLATTDIAALKWNLLREDLSLPAAVLYEDRLRHNLKWMQRFAAAYSAKLAPHGKTSMAPALFQKQLQAGAWGITLATATQTQAAYQYGVRRVLMANQLIGKENMAMISRLLQDPSFEYYCLVDSCAQVEMLGKFYSERAQRLNVLLELGAQGGRSGIRGGDVLEKVMASLRRWQGTLTVCGVEIYEGVFEEESAVRELLGRALDVTRMLLKRNCFERRPALFSGAGSSWYDLVAESFRDANFGAEVELVLRPGCYVTHDVGAYNAAQERILLRNPIAGGMGDGLIPALQVWAYVQSIPEAHTAILTLGKRDAAFDSGYPRPSLHYRPGQVAPQAARSQWQLTRMMDQHAFMEISSREELMVGDMVSFDISHPCLTFDKWRAIPILNEKFDVVDVIRTLF